MFNSIKRKTQNAKRKTVKMFGGEIQNITTNTEYESVKSKVKENNETKIQITTYNGSRLKVIAQINIDNNGTLKKIIFDDDDIINNNLNKISFELLDDIVNKYIGNDKYNIAVM